MTTTAPGFEFELPGDGDRKHYVVCPVHTDDGHLHKLTIRQHGDNGIGLGDTVADIEIDPQLFKSFAMPSVETVCRIAIAQAAGEGAFVIDNGAARVSPELTLDFAVEPWEGDLAPG